MDAGLSEQDFWTMTIGEIVRYIESQRRVEQMRAKQKASMDYILGDLIGRSIARIHSSSATYPSIGEVYPNLFNEEIEAIQEKKEEESVIRFKQFANSFNKRFKKGVADTE